MSNELQKKIDEYERLGLFDKDIWDDPLGREILPDEIKYYPKSFFQKIKADFAFFLAYRYAARAMRRGTFIIKNIVGKENLNVEGGCVLTANHFSPLDSFVMNRVFDASKRKGDIYRVIKEGNYTSFPGFYGFLMRNCNTLPLSSNRATMLKFMRATDSILKDGNCILIYPEQSLWYNYRKPKPLKPGAFDIAVRSNVPVVPCFITMKDSENIGDDGEPIQEHTAFVGKPIYPDASLSRRERSEKLRDEVFEFNKSIYESYYGIPLEYLK